MKWSRPRLTVRRLMIAVAVVAAGFGAIKWVAVMRARSAACRARATEFEASTLQSGSATSTPDGRLVLIGETENDHRWDDYAWRMEAKYLRLAHFPWLVPEPDPPPPKPLAHPRSALELPPQDCSLRPRTRDWQPPAWTLLWTWPSEQWVPFTYDAADFEEAGGSDGS